MTIEEYPTGKEMCETISKYWKERYNKDYSPERIWNYSSSGELAKVFEWYDQAMDYYESREETQ